jgi:hypothetical protein
MESILRKWKSWRLPKVYGKHKRVRMTVDTAFAKRKFLELGIFRVDPCRKEIVNAFDDSYDSFKNSEGLKSVNRMLPKQWLRTALFQKILTSQKVTVSKWMMEYGCSLPAGVFSNRLMPCEACGKRNLAFVSCSAEWDAEESGAVQ